LNNGKNNSDILSNHMISLYISTQMVNIARIHRTSFRVEMQVPWCNHKWYGTIMPSQGPDDIGNTSNVHLRLHEHKHCHGKIGLSFNNLWILLNHYITTTWHDHYIITLLQGWGSLVQLFNTLVTQQQCYINSVLLYIRRTNQMTIADYMILREQLMFNITNDIGWLPNIHKHLLVI